jgi:short subunit dehydrogenase-like uncharacterized protein
MDDLLKEANLVIHCAGPFIHTWEPMIRACLRNECHYLDITGEIEVFEAIKAMDKQFKMKGIMAMPGTGFDVAPTDCMAAHLKKRLPDATHLELAFRSSGGRISRGTANTMVEKLGNGGAIREDGIIKNVPAAYKTRRIQFEDKKVPAVSIPWGDISTAHFSTGIENIVVYTALPEKMIRKMRWSNWIKLLLKLDFVKNRLKKKIKTMPAGPDAEERRTGRSYIWGEVRNGKGKTVQAIYKTKEGYQLTAEMALKIAEKVSVGDFKTGYQTPSGAYGADLIFEIENTEWIKKY